MFNKMRVSKIMVGLRFLLAFSLAIPSTSWAFKCENPSLEKAYSRSDAVIAGLITNAVDGTLKDGKIKTRLFTMQILNVWKGDVGGTVHLLAKYDDYEPSLKIDRNYVLFLDKPDEEGRYPIRYCQLQEDIGEENGYLTTLLLNKIIKGQPRYFLGYKERTATNTSVGYGLGLTDEEYLKKEHEKRKQYEERIMH